ncbi:hypothetical protein KY290_037933 [Solanum tuberosum]|uniref:Uncharacterized protein n=1 Tax=Solanum tuberosum TaxID=4113 RepID=A0ABQ7TXK9_SOLTU|nr:hypothetical protein KY289_037500 [Solanum tuberosum]KAH0640698.1 hypothetical protein KY285_037284 [Solanum tuberosum]KAH0739228.1 hypothetical protein KY290_037933 [Solanum tuberosum]
MAQNEIEEMLANLRRMKSNGSQSSLRINRIEKLEMVLRVLRTFIKCHRVLFSDSSVKLTKNAKSIVRMLRRVFQGTSYIKVDKYSYELIRERQVPHLLEFFEEYMDCLGKNLNDMIMMFLERVRYDPPEENLAIFRFIMQLKIVHKKMKFLRYLYATEINSYVDDEKLECLETRIQFMASNVGQLCLSVTVNVVADFVDNTHKDEVEPYGCGILNKPSYLICLIVLVELEMKKIFLNELKASNFYSIKNIQGQEIAKRIFTSSPQSANVSQKQKAREFS